RLDSQFTATEESHLRRIEQAATQAVGLVKQMMAFGRRSPPEFVHVRLGGVVQESLQLLRSSVPRAIAFEFGNEVADDFVRADASQLQQVFVNLGTNA